MASFGNSVVGRWTAPVRTASGDFNSDWHEGACTGPRGQALPNTEYYTDGRLKCAFATNKGYPIDGSWA